MGESYVNNILKSISYVLLVYAKNREISVVGRKEIGIKVHTEKSKYMVRSRDQNAGQNHNIKMGNISFERVE
jgi:hypothetical protein